MYEIKAEDGESRVGKLKINGREVETPFFMPVVTKGAAKFINNKNIHSCYKKRYWKNN